MKTDLQVIRDLPVETEVKVLADGLRQKVLQQILFGFVFRRLRTAVLQQTNETAFVQFLPQPVISGQMGENRGRDPVSCLHIAVGPVGEPGLGDHPVGMTGEVGFKDFFRVWRKLLCIEDLGNGPLQKPVTGQAF